MGCASSTAHGQTGFTSGDPVAVGPQLSAASPAPKVDHIALISVPTIDFIHQTPENKQKSASTEVTALALLADSANTSGEGCPVSCSEPAITATEVYPPGVHSSQGPEACTSLHEGEACLPGHEASTTDAEMQSTKSSSSRHEDIGDHHEVVEEASSQTDGGGNAEPVRHEEEVAPFQAEKSLTVEKSEASPWTYLQKTYGNVEESAVSTAGQQQACRQGRTTIDQEVIIAHHTATSMQAVGTKILQHEGSTVEPRWQADEWASGAAPESAWAESTPALGLPHAGLHKLPAKQPSASTPAPAQVDSNDLGIQDVDEFEAELAALGQVIAK
ncbi:hypothetical protein WJX82_008736 [Trebouxia sp. C0006]